MSISSEITRLTQAKADIKTAIESKGVTVPSSAKLDDYPDYIDDIEQGSTPNLQTKSVSITENGTTTVEPDPGYDGLSEVGVSVNVQGGGGGGASEDDDVRFIDYDGTLLYSYSASDFLALTSMPENPTHEGLTSQGWNWSLADAKEQVRIMNECIIGQMYITDTGDTEIDVDFTESVRLSPILNVAVNGIIEVDWGDGTQATITGSSLETMKDSQHTYSAPGVYTIRIKSISGNYTFFATSTNYTILRKNETLAENYVYSNCIKAIRIGVGVPSIGDYGICHCRSLETITIPAGVTSIGQNAFTNCYFLKSLTFPIGLTNISDSALSNCMAMESVSFPLGVSGIEYRIFNGCAKLSQFVFPHDVTGTLYVLFNGCNNLPAVTLPPAVTEIGNYAFQNCFKIETFSIPSSIEGIGNNAFYGCYNLRHITIPPSVKSIGSGTFTYSDSLSSITIPSSVTSIGNNAFASCRGLSQIHFLSTTPPTLGGTSVFKNIASDCKIYVPTASLQSYKTATNWSSYASKMVGE